jgi:hypothetical protein
MSIFAICAKLDYRSLTTFAVSYFGMAVVRGTELYILQQTATRKVT